MSDANLARPAAQEKAQADALFNSIGEGAVATDEFGKIVRINPIALQTLGFEASEVLNKWMPKKLVAFDEAGQPLNLIDRPITKAFLTGQSVTEKIYYQRKDGSKVPVAVTVSPIVLNKRPIGAIEVFRDITLENEIDRMKSEFISLASHQLRTPLSAIKTYAHMLLDGYMGDISPSQRRALITIVTASNRMNELISTLLNITRIESGSIAVSPKMINLKRVAEEIVHELEHSAHSKTIRLELRVNAASPTIKTDSLIVKEIITNLVTNAIKYTPEAGNVTLAIDSKDNEILISVSDTGFGIPSFSHDQIFTKFFRAPNVLKRETSGTGLGLYLAKRLTDRLGGRIWFESEEHRGTTFYLALPRQPALE